MQFQGALISKPKRALGQIGIRLKRETLKAFAPFIEKFNPQKTRRS